MGDPVGVPCGRHLGLPARGGAARLGRRPQGVTLAEGLWNIISGSWVAPWGPFLEPPREGPFEGQRCLQFGAGADHSANLHFAAGRNPQFPA